MHFFLIFGRQVDCYIFSLFIRFFFDIRLELFCLRTLINSSTQTCKLIAFRSFPTMQSSLSRSFGDRQTLVFRFRVGQREL